MKKIYNDIIPFKGFISMCLWPLLLIRNDLAWAFNVQVERHENIHGEQQKEMLIVGCILSAILALCGCGWWSLTAIPLFLWWYLTEWLVKLLYYNNSPAAYKNISFEREAYINQNDASYLAERKSFAWVKYIKM